MKAEQNVNSFRKRDSKALRSNSVNENDIWDKMSDCKLTPDNQGPNIDFLDNIEQKKLKSPYPYYCEPSVISDADNLKEKICDNLSVGSKFLGTLNIHRPQDCEFNTTLGNKPVAAFLTNFHNFENFSQQSKGDLSEIKSVSSFSSNSKL